MSDVLSRAEIEVLVFETFGIRRLIHDGPVRPDVWIRYFMLAQRPRDKRRRVSLILTPKRDADRNGVAAGSAGEVAQELRQRLKEAGAGSGHLIAATSRYAVADLFFEELMTHVIPMTAWWSDLEAFVTILKARFETLLKKDDTGPAILKEVRKVDLFRFIALVGMMFLLLEDRMTRKEVRTLASRLVARPPDTDNDDDLDDMPAEDRTRAGIFSDIGSQDTFDNAPLTKLEPIWEAFLRNAPQSSRQAAEQRQSLVPALAERVPLIWSIQRNRRVSRPSSAGAAAGAGEPPLAFSRNVVKADAAIRLFDLSTSNLIFAVIDTGIHAAHLALLEWGPGPRDRFGTRPPSRVKKTLDFTRLRTLMDDPGSIRAENYDSKVRERIRFALQALQTNGPDVDWSVIEPLMWVNDNDMEPADSHGTHVAGILAGHIPPLWNPPAAIVEDCDRPFYGVCPDLRLYDLRVFSGNADADEFSVLAALDYVAWINRDPARPVIHGVNLSLSIRSLVKVSACGRTPVCEAANRLVAMGTVVVAAAGNAGFDPLANGENLGFGYRGMSITDPANAEDVISVGATHWSEPHTYGVSYFSSRGPTGDGRLKPDLVAPGEKVVSAVLGDKLDRKDGTSMAAPHVAGVCALLMARHSELQGRPGRIKEILMRSATDLGRDRHFQGAGLVDALRALQSV